MAPIKKLQVTFDCAEPERLARFWCEVLGYVVPPPPEGFATWKDFGHSQPPEERDSWFACADPSGVGPRLYFQRVPEGKAAKNRVHLDVRAGTGLVGGERLAVLEAECARLVALGAVRERLLPADDDNESCIAMQDIEGNEFCLDRGPAGISSPCPWDGRHARVRDDAVPSSSRAAGTAAVAGPEPSRALDGPGFERPSPRHGRRGEHIGPARSSP
ncbi:hypothetical protein GCM10010327_16340 [Streptomyces nitrosporeus]|nr:hypothetical protein GCM10010327_16340 [Streptomyces nitrosporeus]